VEKKDQHSIHESGQCDGIRKGYLKKENGKLISQVKTDVEKPVMSMAEGRRRTELRCERLMSEHVGEKEA
jgi:hypothetical protein